MNLSTIRHKADQGLPCTSKEVRFLLDEIDFLTEGYNRFKEELKDLRNVTQLVTDRCCHGE